MVGAPTEERTMATLICEKRGRRAAVDAAAHAAEPRARKRSSAGVRAGADARAQPSSAPACTDAQAISSIEREWEALLHESAESQAARCQAAQEERAHEEARLQDCVTRSEGKRWMLAERRAAERALQALRASQRSELSESSAGVTALRPYRQALQSLHSRQTLPSSMKPSRMERKTLSKASEGTAGAARASTARAARPSVLLMTPENAAQSLTLHLRASLLHAPPPLLLTVGDICDECGVQMKVIANDSMLGCASCHKTRLLPNTTTVTVSSTGEFDYSSSTVHQKHRLPEWIEMAQAKQFAEPPIEVLESIVQHLASTQSTGFSQDALRALKAEREARGPFVDAADAVRRLQPAIPGIEAALLRMQSGTVRRVLKAIVQSGGNTRLRKYYEHSAKCASYIGGFWPPRMNAQQEEILRLVYAAAAPAYEAMRKPTQSFWPGGFPYFLRASCALLGWDEFVPLFPLPPGSREGSARHALRKEIWDKDLGWEVVPAYAPLPAIQLRSRSGQGYERFQLLEDDGVDDDDAAGEDSAEEEPSAVSSASAAAGTKRRRVQMAV